MSAAKAFPEPFQKGGAGGVPGTLRKSLLLFLRITMVLPLPERGPGTPPGTPSERLSDSSPFHEGPQRQKARARAGTRAHSCTALEPTGNAAAASSICALDSDRPAQIEAHCLAAELREDLLKQLEVLGALRGRSAIVHLRSSPYLATEKRF